VFYALLLAATGAAIRWGEALGRGEEGYSPPIIAFVGLAVVFGMLRRSTRWLTAIDHPRLDERDHLARSSAFRFAYPLLLGVMLATFAITVLGLPDAPDRTTPLGNGSTMTASGFFLSSTLIVGLLIWGFLWVVFLPTGVLAWREPDAVTDEWEESVSRGPGEGARDAILGVALVAAFGLSVFAQSGGWGLVVIMAALSILAAWTRYGSGQQPISSHLRLLAAFLMVGGALPLAIGLFDASGVETSAWIGAGTIFLVGFAVLLVAWRAEP